MAILMEDTDLESERFLVRAWQANSASAVSRKLAQSWHLAAFMKQKGEHEPLAITFEILDHLTTLKVNYLVGGSIASSFFGEPRFTQDTDLEVCINTAQLTALLDLVKNHFDVNQEAAFEALRRRSSFHLIHFQSQFKIDIFCSRDRPYDRQRMSRRQLLPEMPANFWVSSAEDMVITKLDWYRQGGEISDCQWRDVLSILATQAQHLDYAYMSQWAQNLNLTPLLEKALAQVKPLLPGAG
jgi:hypothetical protein